MVSGLFAAVAACQSSAPPGPSVPCDSTATLVPSDTFALSDVAVFLEGSDPSLAPVRADVAHYLGAMWAGGKDVPVAATAPDAAHPLTLWISTSAAAQQKLGASVHEGYAIGRVDDPGGAVTVVVAAPDAADLAAGAYALLEELGARFYHPRQDLVPALASPRVPHELSIARAPVVTGRRGVHLHTLHPIEYERSFAEPGDASLAEAKQYVDWLARTGQNYVQWPPLSTVDWGSFRAHAQAIVDYAHSRNVRVGVVPELWGGSSLQNQYVLVNDASQWQAQMDAQLDQLMQVGWDVVEIQMGEFVVADPQSVIDWLNHATAHVLAAHPAVEVFVENHVGNYPQFYVPYMGATRYYYHLPQFCDPRLGQDVHTLSLFDLYRDWATYAHPDFHLQHEYILQELPSRAVAYQPESAYWISADDDVPAFLPEFVYARWNDVHTLTAELAQQGLPRLEGHVVFSSGLEWGYWMTDYLAAKMLWEPAAPLEHFFDHAAAGYGSCAADVSSALATFTQLQSIYLFDQRLLPYVQGENGTVDFGYLIGLETHPRRVEFEELLPMSADARAQFESQVVGGLEAMASRVQPIEDFLAERCRGSDATLAPWCDELWDGVQIVRLRLQHAAHLYRAVLAYAVGQDGGGELSQAVAIGDQAAAVVARREGMYRFDVDRLTGVYDNPTIYPYGYLRQAHTVCYWRRREEQVRFLMQNGMPESLGSLESCAN